MRWAVGSIPVVMVLCGLIGGALGIVGCQGVPSARSVSAEDKAIGYLSREVPLWFQDNQCYSCHNNGDAARALFAASALGYAVPASSMKDTVAWLVRPEAWDHNKGEPGFSDRRLARIQFALALQAAIEKGLTPRAEVWERAAALVIEEQGADGAWHIGADTTLGSPATYGSHLATALILNFLRAGIRSGVTQDSVARSQHLAEAWLRRAPVRNVLEAAALLMGLEGQSDPASEAMRIQGMNLIRQAQTQDGGWGPYANTAPEPFDTAVVLLALQGLDSRWRANELIERGRAFLIRTQDADGSWVETTRPPRGESYAQRVSTTGWAALALLASKP